MTSLLTINSQSFYLWHYAKNYNAEKYTIKIFLNNIQTVANPWNFETPYSPNLNWPESLEKIQLSSIHTYTETYGDISVRSGNTANAACISPWNLSTHKYAIAQINNGTNPNTNLEIASMLNINNTNREMIYYSLSNRPSKYNPKIFIGTINSQSPSWAREYATNSYLSISRWPEIMKY